MTAQSGWPAFKEAAPELAAQAEELFEEVGVVLLGTIRKDGSPRISPVEPLFVDGELQLGMMWQSLKALDLLRDPRCTVHNCITDRMAPHGEFKLHGVAAGIQDLDRRKRYCEELKKKINWAPKEPKFHVFEIADIKSAALFFNEETTRKVTRFRPGDGVEEITQTV